MTCKVLKMKFAFKILESLAFTRVVELKDFPD